MKVKEMEEMLTDLKQNLTDVKRVKKNVQVSDVEHA